MSFTEIKDDLNYGLAAFGLRIPDALPLDDWAAKLTEQPCRNAVAFVSLASVLFYLAERGRNPKVNDVYDALIYCTTNISVGYCDIFARTPMGKLIGSVLMTLGPAMAAKTLDGLKAKKAQVGQSDPTMQATQEQILATLREILAKIQSDQPAGKANDDPRRNANGRSTPAGMKQNKKNAFDRYCTTSPPQPVFPLRLRLSLA